MQPEAWNLAEVTPQELHSWLEQNPQLVLLDVREPFEVGWASLPDPRVVYLPMSQLVGGGLPALPEQAQDPERRLVVFCHVGGRSAQVAYWLHMNGWKQVYSLAGGIDSYAYLIDPAIGRYS